jgi:hypothetical protein
MAVTEILGWVILIVCVPLNVVATFLLYKTYRQASHLRVLRERCIVAAITTLLVLVFGLIFVNNDQPFPPLNLAATKVLTRVVMLLMATVPAIGWILLYRSIGRGDNRPKP